jgi:replicative DNA helicase
MDFLSVVSIENTLLSAISKNMEAFEECVQELSPEHFHSSLNSKIFSALVKYYEENHFVDTLQVGYNLDEAEASHYNFILNSTGNPSKISEYISSIKDAYMARQLFALGAYVTEQAQIGEGENLLAEAQEKFIELTDKMTRDKDAFTDIGGAIDNAIKIWHDRLNDTTEYPRYGLPEMDEITYGIPNKHMHIVAGRPGTGKSEFAVQVAVENAVNRGIPVAIFTLEMSREELVERMLSHLSQVELYHFKTGRVAKDMAKLKDTIAKLRTAPIMIDDTTNSLTEILSKIRKMKLKNKNLGLVIVDYLQLVHNQKNQRNREQEIAGISGALKGIGMKLNIAVLALSQLSRKCEERANPKPILSDLRESGALEQDADVVVFLYRPFLLNKNPADKNYMEIDVAKHRHGPVGNLTAYNDLERQTIRIA